MLSSGWPWDCGGSSRTNAAPRDPCCSAFASWYGGWCYGPRYLCDGLPILALFIAVAADRLSQAGTVCKALVGVLLVYSIFVQGVGALCYPRGDWNDAPVDVDRAPARVWDVSDLQIVREAEAGLDPKPLMVLRRFF
ncbi:MAG: hypothetical protein P9M14_15660 [Candidatus Alcyoniella australis]|nr:hypothetical protein [Candidatus Alcyoniella australis]